MNIVANLKIEQFCLNLLFLTVLLTNSVSLLQACTGSVRAGFFKPIVSDDASDETDGAICGTLREMSGSPVTRTESLSRIIAATASTTASVSATVSVPEPTVASEKVAATRALIWAVMENNLAEVTAAVAKGADVNAFSGAYGHTLFNHQTSLMLAVRFKYLDIVNYLLNVPDINVNKREIRSGNTALDLAILTNYQDNNLEIIKLLLNKGADPVYGLSKQTHNMLCEFLEYKIIKERSVAALARGSLTPAEVAFYTPISQWRFSEGYQAVIATREQRLAGVAGRLKAAADYALYLDFWNNLKVDYR